MNWYVGMFTLLCSYVIFSCALGSKCTGGKCKTSEKSVPQSKMIPATNASRTFEDSKQSRTAKLWKRINTCPDHKTACPDGNTCCKLESENYGCCTLPNAVCCSNGINCCPQGYTCDLEWGTCNK